MQLSVKQFVKLKQYQEERIRELWCEQQQEDVQKLIDLMEDVATAAFDARKSAQAYSGLQDAKLNFTNNLLAISERYRAVVEIQKQTHTQTHM